MIVTVTPAPAIDWTLTVDSFDLDAVNRVTRSTKEPSGKGVNVSWALHRAGIPTTAIFPGGGEAGRFMADVLEAEGMAYERIDTGREVRTNVTLVTPGHATKLNEPGLALDDEHVDELTRRVLATAEGAAIVLVCGSLPPSMPPTYPRLLVERLVARGIPVAVDTSGEALTLSLEAKPRLIKPNVHELAELVSRDIATLGDVASAAREAIRRGAGGVLASLGADGAMYIDANEALLATARDIPFVNSVGAGDALLAGFVAGTGTPAARLRNAVLWASSAVAHETTLFPIRREFTARISVQAIDDHSVPLTEPSVPLAPLTSP